jgi:hypothetical protein
MNTMRDLQEAFRELESRADAADTATDTAPAPVERPGRHRGARLAGPAAVAAVVLAVGIAVPVWRYLGSSDQPARVAAGHRGTPSASAPASPTTYQPPTSVAELTAKTKMVLAGTATFSVDESRSSGCGAVSVTLPSPGAGTVPSKGRCSGAALVGDLTSGGVTGGFNLDVYTDPNTTAMCDLAKGCTIQHRSDGSTLATEVWHDSSVPGGVTYHVDYVRADDAVIDLHLSTESDPKGASKVIAPRVPLTIDQMISVVTSDQW